MIKRGGVWRDLSLPLYFGVVSTARTHKTNGGFCVGVVLLVGLVLCRAVCACVRLAPPWFRYLSLLFVGVKDPSVLSTLLDVCGWVGVRGRVCAGMV